MSSFEDGIYHTEQKNRNLIQVTGVGVILCKVFCSVSDFPVV